MSTLAQLPPPDMTPLQMLLAADFIVKLTIAILLAASLATWTVLLGKSIELSAARRRLRAALRTAASAPTLALFAADPNARGGGAGALLDAATTELRLSDASSSAEPAAPMPPEGTKDRIAERLRRIE